MRRFLVVLPFLLLDAQFAAGQVPPLMQGNSPITYQAGIDNYLDYTFPADARGRHGFVDRAVSLSLTQYGFDAPLIANYSRLVCDECNKRRGVNDSRDTDVPVNRRAAAATFIAHRRAVPGFRNLHFDAGLCADDYPTVAGARRIVPILIEPEGILELPCLTCRPRAAKSRDTLIRFYYGPRIQDRRIFATLFNLTDILKNETYTDPNGPELRSVAAHNRHMANRHAPNKEDERSNIRGSDSSLWNMHQSPVDGKLKILAPNTSQSSLVTCAEEIDENFVSSGTVFLLYALRSDDGESLNVLNYAATMEPDFKVEDINSNSKLFISWSAWSCCSACCCANCGTMSVISPDDCTKMASKQRRTGWLALAKIDPDKEFAFPRNQLKSENIRDLDALLSVGVFRTRGVPLHSTIVNDLIGESGVLLLRKMFNDSKTPESPGAFFDVRDCSELEKKDCAALEACRRREIDENAWAASGTKSEVGPGKIDPLDPCATETSAGETQLVALKSLDTTLTVDTNKFYRFQLDPTTFTDVKQVDWVQHLSAVPAFDAKYACLAQPPLKTLVERKTMGAVVHPNLRDLLVWVTDKPPAGSSLTTFLGQLHWIDGRMQQKMSLMLRIGAERKSIEVGGQLVLWISLIAVFMVVVLVAVCLLRCYQRRKAAKEEEEREAQDKEERARTTTRKRGATKGREGSRQRTRSNRRRSLQNTRQQRRRSRRDHYVENEERN